MKILMILAAAMAMTLLPGCIVADGHGNAIAIIPVGHIHSDSCGHYSHRGSWYHHAEHRHCDGCGHRFSGGIWLRAD